MARRKSDSQWRNAALELRGPSCRACGTMYWVQMDHLIARSQGGRSVLANALPLCQPCHQAKTEKRLLIRREWLDADTIEFLADQGWASWQTDGSVEGRGRRGFAPTTTINERVEQL